ncbi:DUF6612 family protein [Salinithrix halophila]|uniref:DUF6612 family protein n=1 Tax=Salinithrix halophila TaxID=1485204 RepID=A0ABV8JGC5_9BACL
MKKLLSFTFIALLSLGLVACGSLTGAGSDNKEANPEEKKDWTVGEVIAQVEKKSQEEKGISYDMNGNQMFTVKVNGDEENIAMNYGMKMDYLNDPPSMHMKGTMKTEEQKLPVEMYLVDNTLYQKAGPEKWLKSKATGMEAVQGAGQVQQPSESVKQFQKVLDKLTGGKEAGPISMKEQSDGFLLKMDLKGEDMKKVMNDLVKQMKASLEPQFQQSGLPINSKDIKITHFSQSVLIDKKTFKQKKINQVTFMEILIKDKGSIEVEQTMQMKDAGKFEGTITVPKEVKSKAEEM